MAKPKTSSKQKKSSKSINVVRLKKNVQIEEFSPTVEIADENFIGRVILECINNDDPEGVIEAIEAHLDAVNKKIS